MKRQYLDDITDCGTGVAVWQEPGDFRVWGVDVYDGLAFTCAEIPDDEEIQHVQDFFAGKYCKLRGHVSNDCLAGPEQFGNWSK